MLRALLSHLRGPKAGFGVLIAVVVCDTGCIDPQGDYDAFVARAPAPDAQIAVDDAQTTEPCPQILAGTPSGTFYGACLTTASSKDVTQATYVKLDTMVAPSADHTTGELTVGITSLVSSPKNISQTVGATTNPPSAPITKDCTYVINAGTTIIPGASNAAKTDLTLSNTRYRGKLLTQDESCTDLDAVITSPVPVDLTMGGNYCIFRRAPADGSITLFKLSEFACPGAPPPMWRSLLKKASMRRKPPGRQGRQARNPRGLGLSSPGVFGVLAVQSPFSAPC